MPSHLRVGCQRGIWACKHMRIVRFDAGRGVSRKLGAPSRIQNVKDGRNHDVAYLYLLPSH
jgi:hypothetical protein